MLPEVKEPIAAISTAFGEAAIAVLRLSGAGCIEIAGRIFRSRKGIDKLPPRVAHLGSIHEGDRKLDDVLLTIFRAPASYTGEDLVEISCHGGVLVARRILEALLRAGARSAEPGEFTRRAFLNRKLDLTQAEAVMDVISAQTDLALRAAGEQLEGRLGSHIRNLRAAVLDTLAQVEAYIDFPDEDITPETGDSLRARIRTSLTEVDALLATAGQGRVLREGLRTVIFGAPNVGKSSVLNRLLGYERAIVSPHAGTTRDVLEETISVRGIPVRLMDTAGIRESGDEIEQAGMERTRKAMARADLILHVVDASSEAGAVHSPPAADGVFADDAGTRARSCTEILVLNKADLVMSASWDGRGGIAVSALDGRGFEELLDGIAKAALGGATQREWSVAINARHQACLENARCDLIAALAAFDRGLSPEFVAEELRAAMESIGDIVGRADTEEVLGAIFGQFCIGK